MQPSSEKFLQKIPELSYVTAENAARYRAIMRYFYLQYNRMKQWLKPEEVYQGVMAWGCLPDYTFEQCQADLEQLEKWKNLTSRHDRSRAMTIEEYLRKKLEYSLTPYSLEIERLLESLAKVTGYGGSLEPTLFDVIVKLLSEIHGKIGSFRTLYYSGDFDVGGLSIANQLQKRFPESFQPWCMDGNTYRKWVNGPVFSQEELVRLKKFHVAWDEKLPQVMAETGRKCFQEMLISQLAEDWLKAIDCA